MKRRKSKPTQARHTSKANAPTKKPAMTRRDLIGWAKFAGIGAVVLGARGWYTVSRVQAGIAEADLDRIGNGTPTVVQIHDPGCPSCNRLKRAAKDALTGFEDGALQFLVANLNDPVGREFARGHGVGRVTLLLFDGQGKRVASITGVRSAEELTAIFRQHAGTPAS